MEADKIVVIRADANAAIASGHIMRCLTIAQALRRAGCTVLFLTADEDGVSMLQSRGETNVLCLHSSWENLDLELPVLLPLLIRTRASLLLLDSYYASALYMNSIRQLCKLVYLDDLDAFPYPVDLLINYDPLASQCDYGSTSCLLGPSYAPLREQFLAVPYSVHTEVTSVLISTGGSDPYNTAGRLLRAAQTLDFYRSPNLTFHLLIGNMNPHKTLLVQMAALDSRICLHENIGEMAALLAGCDLAFSAGGTTLFELCAVGVPAVSFSISDVQFDCVHAFDKTHIIPYAGDVREGDAFYEKILSMGMKIAEDFSLREKSSAKMRQLIDGRGAERIAASILSL